MARRRVPQAGPLGLIPDIANPPPSLAGPLIELGEEYLRVPGGLIAGEPLTLTDEQLELLWVWYSVTPNGRRFVHNRKMMLRMAKGYAKALSLDTRLPTPGGWTTMGDVVVGDLVYDEHGQPTRVVAATEVLLDHDCYRVTFRDGTSIVADAGHLWPVLEFTGRKRVPATVPTHELVDLRFKRPLTKGRTKSKRADVARWLSLPTPILAGVPSTVLPMPAYLLGYWLGDGDSDQARITVALWDLPSLEAQAARVGWPLREPSHQGDAKAVRVRFGVRGQAAKALTEVGVLRNKHIPVVYLQSSAADRLELLRGLMDSDGTVDAEGRQCSFTTTSSPLATGFVELVRSLGLYPRSSEFIARLDGRPIGPGWRITFSAYDSMPPFHLPRHAERLKPRPTRPYSASRTIVSVEQVDSVPVRCITVDAPSSLYLAGDGMIPTHNSPIGAFDAFANLVGDVVPDGLDAYGRPVGRPHPAPWYQVVATSLDQTDNLFMHLYNMLRESPAIDDLKLDIGLTRIRCWDKMGQGIEPASSEGGSREGQPLTGAAKEETQLWTATNGGVLLNKTIDANLTKAGGGVGRALELYNAYTPGTGSIAEKNEKELAAGRRSGILHVAREAVPPKHLRQMRREAFVRDQLAHVYGSAAMERGGWIDLERTTQDIVEAPDDELPDKIRKFFNLPWSDTDGGLDQLKWARLARPGKRLKRGDTICLGFDGSDTGDSTALYAVRWPDWHLVKIKVWERPLNEDGSPIRGVWRVPRSEVKDEVRATCRLYRVVRGYFDDAGWQSEIDELTAEFGQSVMRFPHRQDQRIGPACERWTTMIADGALTHDGDPTLSRHAANVRRVLIGKPGSKWWRPAKKIDSLPIDAFPAAVSAVHALGDAVAHGEVKATPPPASASSVGPVRTDDVFRPKDRLQI